MRELLDYIKRYSKATGIPLKVENKQLDLSAFFNEAYEKGFVSEEMLVEIQNTVR